MMDIDQQDVLGGELSQLPPERLVEMLREKRQAEAAVRSKLRDAEGERDRLREVVTTQQAGAFRGLARSLQAHDTALEDLPGLVPFESLLGEDGLLDEVKATAALGELRAQRPHLFHGPPASSGGVNHTGAQQDRESSSWASVLGR